MRRYTTTGKRRPGPNDVDCPYCEGDGEIMDERRITGRSIDPPMMDCPECNGRGFVASEDAANVDPDKTIDEYAQDDAADAAEHRWEMERDR